MESPSAFRYSCIRSNPTRERQMREEIDHVRRRFVGSAATTLVAARLGALGAAVQQISCAMPRLPDEGEMPTLDGATSWLNSAPLTSESLHGKVVLVQFWTYTCINWLRTLPYVRAWAEKYGGRGLVVIGV